MLKLGVNIDHVATLRQARGASYPDPLDAARACEAAAADSITVHLREDRRHIQDADVHTLRRELNIPLNLEMANVEQIIRIGLDLLPAEVCLVPEKREEITTEGGLEVAGQREALRDTVSRLSAAGILVSLFVEPDPEQLDACAEIGAPVVELHTGSFCSAADSAEPLRALVRGAGHAHRLGLQVNAGHGITLDNIGGILTIPHLDTLNIGHSIVARSILVGMQEAVSEMRRAMNAYGGPPP